MAASLLAYRTTRTRALLVSALIGTWALASSGCAKQQVQRPPAPAAQTAADRAYRTLVESLGVDVTPLQNRVIVLDPGHGGSYRGAMGPGGTAEADVNLAVGLFLWGLLHDAGAQVHLTRTVDRDLVGGTPHPPAIRPLPNEVPIAGDGAGEGAAEEPALVSADSLPSDLAARVERANALSPDLFLSIHHNADAGGDSTRNQTLTFYRLGDAGPSLDAARAIHRHLMRNLGTAGGEVRPGNYHVLRNSRAVAAVLGEPSFLTNPAFEAKLGRIDRVELEATAYFLGIVDYFSRGVAHTLITQPRAGAGSTGEAVELSAAFLGSPVDPGSVRLALDGRSLPTNRVPSAGYIYVAAVPAAEVANGRHRATAEARCLGGNAVAPGELQFEIRRPPAEIYATPWPAWNGGPVPGALGLAVEVRDRFGLPVADSTQVLLSEPISDSARTEDGRAWFVLDPVTHGPRRWRVEAMGLTRTVPAITPGAPAAMTGSIRAAGTGRPVAGAELRDGAGGAVLGYTNPQGRFAVPVTDAQVQATAPGFLPGPINRHQPVAELAPVLGGVLFGRSIAIDAAGGGSEPLQVSATGVRASDATLMAARALASEITWAGAHPTLLRSDDRTLPDLARVETAEAAGAELYVRFGAGPAPKIRHYPGSQRGSRLAQTAAAEIQAECGLTLPVVGEVTPILLLTSSPAIEIVLPAPTNIATEDQLLDPAFLRRVGRAMAIALAADAGLSLPAQGTVRLTASQILLDGRTILGSPTTGEALLIRVLEPTPAWHEATALGPTGEPGASTHFSVAPGDTVDLRL
jgi:N-acetylmuramoyl-L-alanine amidase